MSWRILLGAAAGVLAGVVGVPVAAAVAVGVGVYAASVLVAMPKATTRVRIDPFTVGEPWRQLAQAGLRARQRLASITSGTEQGPLRERLQDILTRLDRGLADGWAAAKRGDELDGAVSRLDPTALRSRLTTLQQRAAANPTDDLGAAIASVESQLATAERLKQLSATTADRLRLSQARLDELVARAAEVTVGTSATDTFAHEVDSLVVELEALHRAVDDVARAEAPAVDVDADEATGRDAGRALGQGE
jgi:hypothetical protein